MSRRPLDLLLLMAWGVAAVAASLLEFPGVVTAFIALPLVLVLPGYGLAAVLFPAGSLGLAARALVTVGGSLAIVALSGLAISATPRGLSGDSWLVVLGSLVVVLGALGIYRRTRRAEPLGGPLAPGSLLTRAQLAWFALAGVITVTAFGTAALGALQQPRTEFAALWMIPQGDGTARLGVENREGTRRAYVVRLLDGERVLGEWSLGLDPDAAHEWTVTLPPATAPPTRLLAHLYRAEDPTTPIRAAAVWHGTAAP